MSTLLSLSIVGLMFAVGAAVAAWFLYRYQVETTAWPTTTGVVLTSELRHTSAETADHKRQLALVPFVRYQYAVDGKTFVGKDISTRVYRQFARSVDTLPSAELRAVMDRYPVSSQVKVHYNPKNPAFAVLEIDRSGTPIFLVVAAGGTVLSIGCLVAWVLTRQK